MFVRIKGKLFKKQEQSVIIDVNGLYYEVLVPSSVLQRIEHAIDEQDNITLIIYHYLQGELSRGSFVLVGFINEVERDFFQHFIKVSGIGPKAAVKALNKPISEITRAIDEGDLSFLKSLPGIGAQRAKEIIAKLQGKIGRFGLIQDKALKEICKEASSDLQEEALSVLVQLQYKKQEALGMIQRAMERTKNIKTTEDLLNEIYKHKVNR